MMELIITSSVLILVIVGIRFFLGGRISACIQYALWALVALRLLLPCSLFESPVSVMNLMPKAIGVVENNVLSSALPSQNLSSVLPAEQISVAGGDNLKPVLQYLVIGIWLGAAALCALVFLAANLRLSSRLRKSRVPLEQSDCKLVVYIVKELSSPCLYGLWKPSIYLTPISTVDATRLTYIITHEQTHYRHKDHLWALVRVICVCLHWYNPLVWLAAVLSQRDSELACDESALKQLGDTHRISYGKTLIEMMTAPASPSDLLSLATTMSGSKNELAERLRRIAKRPKMLVWVVLLTLLFVGIAVAVTFGSAPKESETPENFGHAEQLWNARVEYAGDTPGVGKLVGLLPVPQRLQYDHFELDTKENPYSLTVCFKSDEESSNFYAETSQQDSLQRNALTLFALIDNVDSVILTLDDGQNPYSLDYTREWADICTGGDVRSYAENSNKVTQLLEIPLDTDEWVKIMDSSAQTSSEAASYSVTRFGKGGEVISIAALTDETLVKNILMDAQSKSAAWQGVDVETLEEYYLIEQSFSDKGETHQYYAYLLKDGSAVLQSENKGMYSYLSQELYDALDSIYVKAIQRTTNVLHNLHTDGPVTISNAELPAYNWKTTNEKIIVKASGAVNPVVIELYDADNHNNLLMTFTLDAKQTSNTFTNLASAGNYWIWATGDRNATLTISED